MDAPGYDDPMTLDEACRVVFRGAIKPATLKTEARRGRLVIERIGRKDFVTRAALKKMRNLCRLPAKADVPAVKPQSAYGMSETERALIAQAAALASARALRRRKPS